MSIIAKRAELPLYPSYIAARKANVSNRCGVVDSVFVCALVFMITVVVFLLK